MPKSDKTSLAATDEEISIIEANLDDMNPQIYGHFQESALTRRAGRVHHARANEKKSTRHVADDSVQTRRMRNPDDLIFAETTTFGARTYNATTPRLAAGIGERFDHLRRGAHESRHVNGHILHVTPEYEDCRKLAVEKHVPLQKVISDAQQAFVRSAPCSGQSWQD